MSALDPNDLISSGGLLMIAFIVFAESGLLFGFFFPGDTLLFAAGVLAASGNFNILTLVIIIIISAILGGQSGYFIGQKVGPRLFKREDGIIFRKEYVIRSEKFYEKHGGKTIILARFVPVVRTFAPVVAGIGKMNQVRFITYNIIGSGIWAGSITLIGYHFGSRIDNIETYVLPIVLLATLGTLLPTIYHIFKDPLSRTKLRSKLKSLFR